jgi:hypothetical protein
MEKENIAEDFIQRTIEPILIVTGEESSSESEFDSD